MRGGRSRSTSPVIPREPEEPTTLVAKYLKVTTEELSLLPETMIQETMAKLALDLPLQAKVLLSIRRTTDQPRDALALHFAEKERRLFDPWLVDEAKFRTRRDKFLAEDIEALKTAFVDLAKSNAVSATECVMATYALFVDRKYLAGILVRELPEDRIKAHNFLVAKLLGDDFLLQHGLALSRLPWPLFPPDPRLTATNVKLLMEARECSGGAPTSIGAMPKVFRPLGQVMGGEPNLPVLSGPDGPYVDCFQIANITRGLEAQVTKLSEQRRNQPSRPYQQQQQHPQQRHYNQPNHSYQGRNRGGYQGGSRGGHGGRGGHWRGPRGGEGDADGEAPDPHESQGQPQAQTQDTQARFLGGLPMGGDKNKDTRSASIGRDREGRGGEGRSNGERSGEEQSRASGAEALSSQDIDAFLAEAGCFYVPAALFFRWQEGTISTNEVLRSMKYNAPFVVHFRHHWVTIVIDATTREAQVWDSAPSPMVTRDLTRAATKLGWTRVEMKKSPRQARGSQECGLFAVAAVLLLTHVGYVPEVGERRLAHLRKLFYARKSAEFLAELSKTYNMPRIGSSNPNTTSVEGGAGPAQQCTAARQSKKGGGQCKNTVTSTPRTREALCQLHTLLMYTGPTNETCRATTRNGQCKNRAADKLTTCSFHTDDDTFRRWCENYRIDQEVQPPAPDDNVQLLEALAQVEDPDIEDECYAAVAWTMPANYVLPPTLGANATLSELRAHLHTAATKDFGHPLAKLAWRKATLKGHARALRTIVEEQVPPTLLRSPMVPALLEIFAMRRRNRGWTWSTTLRNLAELAGALKNLPVSRGIPMVDLSVDPQWLAAIRGTAGQAKEERPKVPEPISSTDITKALINEPRMAVRRLLAMTWLCCGRTGDVRQLAPGDVTREGPNMTVTFRRGKTIQRRGPYSLHTTLPEEWTEIIKANEGNFISDLKLATVSDVLATVRRISPRYENRSIRRGALQTLANTGVPEDTLLLFSGHTNVCTLRRYLAWGAIGTAKKQTMTAAARALAPEPRVRQNNPYAIGGEGPVQQNLRPIYDVREAPPPYSETWEHTHELHRLEHQARNFQSPERWLKFLGKEAPPVTELPMFERDNHEDEDEEEFPLSSKPVAATANIEELVAMIESGPLPRLSNGHIKRWCRVFSVTEREKKRRRHICEPLINDLFIDTETICFQNAADRDNAIARFSWAISLDFSSQYDQFGLHEAVRPNFGIKLPGGSTTMAVLPMGFRPSAAVGQAATWAITDVKQLAQEALHLEFHKDFIILTYIDNILILAHTKEHAT
ncbi:TATE DNA transposon, putative, partial [Bodo saltans]